MKGGGNHMLPHQKPRRPKSWQGANQSHNNLKRNISHPLTLAHVKEISPYSITLSNEHSQTGLFTRNSPLIKNLVRTSMNAVVNYNPNKSNISIAEKFAQKYRNTEHSKLTQAFVNTLQNRKSALKQNLQNETFQVERAPKTEEEYKKSYSRKIYNTIAARGETNA